MKMNKRIRRRIMAAILCVAMMIMTMSSTLLVGAKTTTGPIFDGTQEGSLTINKQKLETNQDGVHEALAGATFDIYRVIDIAETDGKVTYSINEKFAELLADLKADDIAGYSTAKLESLIQDTLVPAIAAEDSEIVATQTGITGENGSLAFTGLDLGYYLVIESEAPENYYVSNEPFFVAVPETITTESGDNRWNYDVVVTPKNASLPITKEILESEERILNTTKNVGDVVTYTIDAKIPKYANDVTNIKYNFTDTMSHGLTFNRDIVVKVGDVTLDPGADYTVETTEGKDSSTVIKINFVWDSIKAYQDETISITYTAIINESAVHGNVGNDNQVVLEYTNDPSMNTSAETVPPVFPIVYVYGIEIIKVSDTNEKLNGAEFKLYKDVDGVMTEIPESSSINSIVTTAGEGDEAGRAIFYGLEAGTYYIEETKAPEGYNLLSKPIKVVITAVTNSKGEPTGAFTAKFYGVNGEENEIEVDGIQSTGLVPINVINNKGFELPQTGGAGTIMFTVGGIALIGVAVVLLMKSRKTKTVK